MNKKLKGGALLFVIGIASIIALLVSAMAVLLLYTNIMTNERKIADRLHRNVDSAITWALVADHIGVNDTLLLDLYNEGCDSVKLIKRQFGGYQYLIAEAYEQSHSVSKLMLLGSTSQEDQNFALYLADNNRPVSISGTTKIIGNAYLPQAGIRKAYIEGQAYRGKEHAVDGRISTSRQELAPLDSNIIQYLTFFLREDVDSLSPEFNVYMTQSLEDSVCHSFSEQTMLISVQDSLLLQKLEGNLILYARYPITIKREARLKGVVIFAPSIRVEEGFSGQAQLFAKDSLIMEKQVTLEYPSTVGLIAQHDEVMPFQPIINIQEGCRILGTVFSFSKGKNMPPTLIKIDSASLILGQVYTDSFLQLQGTVYGSTVCKQFSLRTASTLYENFILNGEMNLRARPSAYVGSLLLHNMNRLAVAQWLK